MDFSDIKLVVSLYLREGEGWGEEPESSWMWSHRQRESGVSISDVRVDAGANALDSASVESVQSTLYTSSDAISLLLSSYKHSI